MASSSPRLTALQLDLLREFFARTQRFFLTGGGALAAFYLQPLIARFARMALPPE